MVRDYPEQPLDRRGHSESARRAGCAHYIFDRSVAPPKNKKEYFGVSGAINGTLRRSFSVSILIELSDTSHGFAMILLYFSTSDGGIFFKKGFIVSLPTILPSRM